jgi:phosphatidate cytidylyltransferase
MKTVYSRLLTFFVGIPFIVCVILFLPFLNHLALNLLIVVASIIGSSEIASFYRSKSLPAGYTLPIVLGALFPIAAYLEIAGIIAPEISYLVVLLVVWLVLLAGLFKQREERISAALGRVAANLAISMYPGILAAFLVRIAGLPRPELGFLIFIIPVFLNDSMAYVFGMLLGKNNRGIFPVSEKKSVAGLIAGLVFSIGGTVVFYLFFPEYFGSSLTLAIVLGAGVAVAAVAGDLVVSTLKRSAGVKDSGNVIPGRGGILDSIDSIVFAAPVFYLLIRYFA